MIVTSLYSRLELRLLDHLVHPLEVQVLPDHPDGDLREIHYFRCDRVVLLGQVGYHLHILGQQKVLVH